MAQMATADPLFSEKARIVAHATEALDGQQNAMAWLERASLDFDGRTPLEVLSSANPDEIRLLDDILTAFQYGISL